MDSNDRSAASPQPVVPEMVGPTAQAPPPRRSHPLRTFLILILLLVVVPAGLLMLGLLVAASTPGLVQPSPGALPCTGSVCG